MKKVVLLRHGQSTWNKENRFTGWKDVPLSEQGVLEAKSSGKLLKEAGFQFDLAYTSYLMRAIKTLWIALEEMDQMHIPVIKDWRLNERHYGGLTGLNKKETAEKHGADQVHIWRRSYDIAPPKLDKSSEHYPGNDPKYSHLLEEQLPLSECLKDTVDRFVPYFENEIAPKIKAGKTLLIAAHGNTLRALVKYLDNVSEAEITGLNIPTGVPLVYELDDNLKPLKNYYLGDQEKIQAEIAAVATQSKT